MIHDDAGIRASARQTNQVDVLVVLDERVERQTQVRKPT